MDQPGPASSTESPGRRSTAARCASSGRRRRTRARRGRSRSTASTRGEGRNSAVCSLQVPSSKSLDGVKILLVEDDEDIRDLLRMSLEARGAVLTAVESSSAAVAAIGTSPPDIVISDISMPGEDGHALLRKVRSMPLSSGGKIPAIALTALDSRE